MIESEVSRTGEEPRILGRDPGLRAALERASRLAESDLPVLVRGETGTGKELVARHVHFHSRRSNRPFLPVNCAALSPSLLLSDLFGHVRGAFTGADRDRSGLFESARGGTVFLDEIGDLPDEAQGKLLRVLQTGEVRRVGESRSRRVEVRIVAATHRDLEALARRGRFRPDLFYRLGVGTVELPPLRQRGGDIVLLAEHFLARCAEGRELDLSAGARRALRLHSWPGNVRELENVVAVAAALTRSDTVRADDLELPRVPSHRASDYHRQVEDFRRCLVREALDACDGNRAAAARRLGLTRQAISYLAKTLLD